MKAIVIHSYGGPDVLKYEDAPRPEPKEDEILIRVIAASVNPVDVAIRSGKYRRLFSHEASAHSRNGRGRSGGENGSERDDVQNG